MKILKIKNNQAVFIIGGKEIDPEELTRDDLLSLLDDVYSMDDLSELEIPGSEDLDKIKHTIKKEIVAQIVKKIKEFKENVPNIKASVNSNFPEIPPKGI